MTEKERAELLAKCRETYGEVGAFPIKRDGEIVDLIVVKAASPGDYKRFRDKYNNPKAQQSTTVEELARVCVVHPDRETFKELLKTKPVLAEHVSNKAIELAGGDIEELGKD